MPRWRGCVDAAKLSVGQRIVLWPDGKSDMPPTLATGDRIQSIHYAGGERSSGRVVLCDTVSAIIDVVRDGRWSIICNGQSLDQTSWQVVGFVGKHRSNRHRFY